MTELPIINPERGILTQFYISTDLLFIFYYSKSKVL